MKMMDGFEISWSYLGLALAVGNLLFLLDKPSSLLVGLMATWIFIDSIVWRFAYEDKGEKQ